jgi:signal transduction histidine kinase
MNPEVLIIGGAAIFSILVFFIIIFIVLYQQRYYRFLKEKQHLQNSFQSEILKTQLETQENTFFQIGEEIHDNIGQLLSSTKMFLGVTEQSLAAIPDPLKKAQETLGKAIFELRALSKSLNREWLNQFNLIQNLETEIDRINAANTFKIELHTSVRLLPLTPEAQVMLFRIIQEAMHNSLKHANARTIQIIINLDDLIRITVADDGKGFQTENKDLHGVGIINMKNRTRLLGGTIEWNLRENGGTEIQIMLPVFTSDLPVRQTGNKS